MNVLRHTLYLRIDQDQLAVVFLEALLGKSFEILAMGEGEVGVSLLERGVLDWVIVDIDAPDGGEVDFIKSENKLKESHGFVLLSGQTVGVMAWEKFHGRGEKLRLHSPINAEEFISLFSSQAQEKIS